MSDPLRILWDALAAGGYGPHGQPHDFRARCPGHDGDNSSALHVSAGAGGVVLLWCFAHGCATEDIIAPLNLRMRDLYPVDPGNSGRRLPTARREDFTGNARLAANTLLALTRLDERWTVSILMDECPNCEWPHALLVIDSAREPFIHCRRGCEPHMLTQALAERLTERRRRAA
jgi:hypothetical protein